MKVILTSCLLLLIGCTETKPESQNEVLTHLNKSDYHYSVNKSDIPDPIIDSISSINREPFTIGDSTDKEKINLSDVRFIEDGKDMQPYKRKLHFLLINDTFCLIAYTQLSGIGTHDVIDYFQYKECFKHIRYISTDHLNDTIKLEKFLRTNPAPEK